MKERVSRSKSLVSVGIALALLGSVVAVSAQREASAAGIPVFDAVQSTLSAWRNTFMEVSQFVRQGEQLKTEIQSLQNMTGQRALGMILDDPQLRQVIDGAFNSQYFDIAKDGFAALSADAKSVRDKDAVMDCKVWSSIGLDPTDAKELTARCERELAKTAQDTVIVMDAFAKSKGRLEQIQKLQQQIDSGTPDAKAIAELQARIQGETAQIQNESVMAGLFKQQSEIEDRKRQQAVYERVVKSTAANINSSVFTRVSPSTF